jgi:hypothetical protein
MPERAPSDRELAEVPFGRRVVVLCRGHALIARNSGIRTFKGLREFYGSGRRSFVARRTSEAGSIDFDQRASRGRRASDWVPTCAQSS